MRDDKTRPSDVAGHVAYEIQAMATFCRRAGEVPGTDWIAFMEASLLHARCLLEFLFSADQKRKSGPGDIRPDHLVEGWREQPKNEEYLRYKQFIDRHVAHLTLGRVPNPEPDHDEDIPELEAVVRFVLSTTRAWAGMAARDEGAMAIIRTAIAEGALQMDGAPRLSPITSTTTLSTTTTLSSSHRVSPPPT